jgi:thiamine biosynthesis protein ThiS
LPFFIHPAKIQIMKVQINGEDRDFQGSLSLSALIEQLEMKADRVAVELNRDIVPRVKWAETQINDGDRLEIVQFVGGGFLTE